MKCISLLTDFGEQDGFVGVMKGVIYGFAPDVRIIDLTHRIQPQNILQAAVLLETSYRYFPDGSIHLAVVDPGVGTSRAGVAAKIGKHLFVAPDNGLLTGVLESAEERVESARFVRLDNKNYWLTEISRTFHGRDIFAPVAAHLANGARLDDLGSVLEKPVRIDLPCPRRTQSGWEAEVLWIDVFGNIITSLKIEQVTGTLIKEVQIGGAAIRKVVNTFGDGEPGDLAAFWDSSGRLSICVVNGNAAGKLSIHPGDMVIVSCDQMETSQ